MSQYSVKINREQGVVEVSGDKDFVNEKLRQLEPFYAQVPEAEPSAKGNGPAKPRKTRPRMSPKTNENGAAKTTRRRTSGSTRIKSLDLAPKGMQSFEEFVVEKQPKSQHDKNVVSVYYLTEIAEIESVTSDHVFTCYRDMSWAIPPNMKQSLFLTASKKAFLDTSDLDDLTVEPRGTNHVERALPQKKES